MSEDDRPYRPNVGIALFNRDGRVLIGRAESSGPEIVWPGTDWQMPQGGIDPEEDIEVAARREIWEETNVRSVEVLAVTSDWWTYEFPDYEGPPHKLTPFRGQKQRWVALRFTGEDGEIDVANPAGGQPQEFFEWRWERLAATPDLVVPYKRAVYRKVADAFAGFAR
ncbi:MAG: RNA pyrophosphohydrolase [Hyphomicrobiaceae bacterium]